MKIVCTSKNGKRVLVDTLEVPSYKALYNNEFGKPFVEENIVEKPMIEVVKPKTVKKTTKSTKSKK